MWFSNRNLIPIRKEGKQIVLCYHVGFIPEKLFQHPWHTKLVCELYTSRSMHFLHQIINILALNNCPSYFSWWWLPLQGVYRTFQTLERLTFEIGLRKPSKALVLEMEPYKMKKSFYSRAKKKFVESQIFLVKRLCWAIKIFCRATNFFFVARAL